MQRNNKQHRKRVQRVSELPRPRRYQTPPDLTAKGMQQPYTKNIKMPMSHSACRIIGWRDLVVL